MASKIKLFLIGFIVGQSFSALESPLIKQLRQKYNFKGHTSYSPIIHWIAQKGGCSWLHALWAQVAKNYWCSNFAQGGTTTINPSRTGKPGWWENDLSWLQDANVQMAMMRFVIHQDESLLKAFFKTEWQTKYFTMMKKVASACVGYLPINDDLFFKYIRVLYNFLKKLPPREIKQHLSGTFDCPDLYEQVFKASTEGVDVMLDETFILPDSLQAHKGSLVSFYQQNIGIGPCAWFDLLTKQIKELFFRVRVEGNHWVLYTLNSSNSGRIEGTWYESRSQNRIPFFKDFEDLTTATLEQIEEAEDNWSEIYNRFASGKPCTFKIIAGNRVYRRPDIMIQLLIDYSTSSKPECLNKFAVAYLRVDRTAELLKNTNFLFVRKSCPGFEPIVGAMGQLTEIEVESSLGFPVSVKLQTSKEQIEQYNKENMNKKGAHGESFKPLCSKQSFYFSGIDEFLAWAKDFVFVS